MYRNLTPREEKLLEFLNAYGEKNLAMAEQNQANIDYLSIMSDIPIPENNQEGNENA